ncbi:hypothetical protein EG68_09741 [Paragonimus skrjabini miyazakii]|uniref:Retropepsins domain-containing protein n=1 Tax=Paragonimus skrjabini miyazakii TaxID=59628 RepID=A0A8S9YFJ8_9TREM|nr:hypothetical protein EG68_09741 [Paragonimus skrjabini miyazakii]
MSCGPPIYSQQPLGETVGDYADQLRVLVAVEPAPCTNVRLGSGEVNASLDTGDSCSLLHPEFTQGFNRHDDNRKVKAVNGTILKSLGVTQVPVVINEVSVFHNFVVSEEIPWEAIIGCEFLKRFSCTVDFDRQVFRCGTCELLLTVETSNETEWDIELIDALPDDLNYQINSLLSASKQATTASNQSQLYSVISKRAAASS